MPKELLRQYRGKKPELGISSGGLEHFEQNLQAHLGRADYRERDKIAQTVESVWIPLAELRTDLSFIAKRFPRLAPLLLALACTTAPANGELPKEPTPIVLTLPSSDSSAGEAVVTNNPDLDVTATSTTKATTTRSTPTPTRTATPTKTRVAPKTPTSTATTIPEQAATPEQATAIITCINTVIRRSGPGTGYPQVGTCAAGETIDLATVEGKSVSGGYTWLKIKNSSGEYYIAVISSRMTVDVKSINALPTLKASELPATPTPTPTGQENLTQVSWVTIPEVLLTFSSPGGNPESELTVAGQRYKVLQVNGVWLEVDLGSGVTRWVVGAGLTIQTENSTTTLKTAVPVNEPLAGSPETNLPPLISGSSFVGMSTPSGIVVATRLDDLTKPERRTVFGNDGSETCTLIHSVYDPPESGGDFGARNVGMRTYETGRVVSAKTVGNNIEIVMTKPDGQTITRTIPRVFGISFFTQFSNGAEICLSGGDGQIRVEWFPPGVIIGLGDTEIMMAYSR